MEVAGQDSDWRSAAFRQKLVSQIDDVMRKAGVAHSKSSKDMESHVFLKAKTRVRAQGMRGCVAAVPTGAGGPGCGALTPTWISGWRPGRCPAPRVLLWLPVSVRWGRRGRKGRRVNQEGDRMDFQGRPPDNVDDCRSVVTTHLPCVERCAKGVRKCSRVS
uniref:Mediator of RNA polymerase II transcription subunit 15 n=1 Tax=Ornithorhynchus anatinus TaxID=9258 RepID=A0A6I8PL92_ORNAN